MKLLQQSPSRIGRPAGAPLDDAVPQALAGGSEPGLRRDLEALLGPGKVLSRVSDLVRYASDASPYRLVPQVVVMAQTTDDVARVLRYCAEHGRHATFRAAGTSLSGQSQGDDVIIDVRRHWAGMVVEDDGAALRVRPGTILSHASAVLARHGRRLGPDPASARVACVGGVLANNAAGMRCTPERSAYSTVRHLTFVLPSGTVINTEDADAEQAFAAAEPDLARGLLEIRAEILADPAIEQRIRDKFSIRNTMGYTMKAFLDADTPLGIFKRLLIGSEGTLAFIAEAVMETLPIPAVTGVVWLHLPSVADAVALVPRMSALGAEAVEMILATSLTGYSAKLDDPPAEWVGLPEQGASLLVEFGAESLQQLDEIADAVREAAATAPLVHPVTMSADPAFVALSWHLRGNMNGDMAKTRPAGSAIVQEDVCFPPARLTEAVTELKQMLSRYGYPDSVAGHAAYGNMHFAVTPKLDDPDERERYGAFMDEFATMVVEKYNGSLKAEHGTGINMAPFVPVEWGERITALMWRARRLADPHAVLGKDVLIAEDPKVHLRRFRSEPSVDPIVDACIECGFCEAVCPSRNTTTTPRQRIVLRREMRRQAPGSPVLKALLEEYQYDAIETCAVDSSCSSACPYGIDTGALMKQYRVEESGPVREAVAHGVARHWGAVEAGARGVMAAVERIQDAVGHRPLTAVAGAARTVVSNDLVPTVPGPMPRAAKRELPATSPEDAAAVYFPACVNRIFGRDPSAQESMSLPEALVAISARAGKPLWIPGDVDGHCCGTIWSSKGYTRGRDHMYDKVARALVDWSGTGSRPVVVDAASCTHGLLKEVPKHLGEDLAEAYAAVQIIDSTAWAAGLLPDLEITNRMGTIAVHPGCSITKLGLEPALRAVAGAVAERVEVPYGSACCGTAGDRGLLHPELVVSATQDERRDLESIKADAHVSANRTCEMGLSQVTGVPFESIVFALEKHSVPRGG